MYEYCLNRLIDLGLKVDTEAFSDLCKNCSEDDMNLFITMLLKTDKKLFSSTIINELNKFIEENKFNETNNKFDFSNIYCDFQNRTYKVKNTFSEDNINFVMIEFEVDFIRDGIINRLKKYLYIPYRNCSIYRSNNKPYHVIDLLSINDYDNLFEIIHILNTKKEEK